MRVVFFTIVDDRYYYQAGTPKMINSFKRFHPDIDLVIFRQDMIDKVFSEKKINFYMAKPTFAKLLTPYYDLVVNLDCDHIILAPLTEILVGNYDIAAPWNYNDYENTSVAHVTEKMFVQGGLVASTSKRFWDIYEEMNKDAMKYKCRENDILNLIWYGDYQFNTKILDKDLPLYYGCKLLGKESQCYLKDNKVWCGDSQVKLYHHAKGGFFPKLDFRNMDFKPDVADFMEMIGGYGKSVIYGSL